MRNVGNVLYEYLQDVQSVLSPGIAAAFLLGILSSKATPKGGMWGMITGFIIGVIRIGSQVIYTNLAKADGYSDVSLWAEERGVSNWFYQLFYDVNWLFFSGGMLVLSILVIMTVSRFTPKASPAQLQGLTFASATTGQKAATRASWNHWDLIHTAIIFGLTVAFYIYFW